MTTPWLSPQQPAGIEHWDANLIEDWYEAVAQQAYGNSTLGLLGNAMGVLLVAATLWRDVPLMLMLAWAVPVLAQSVFLFQHLKQWPNAVANDTLFHANYARYTLLFLANGLLWGSVVGLVSFAPSHEIQELVLIACVIVTAGSVAIVPMTTRVRLAFLMLALVPLTLFFAFQFTIMGALLAAALLAHLAYCAHSGELANLTTNNAVAQRFANAQLLTEISASKQKTEQLNIRLNEQLAMQRDVETNLLAAKEQAELAARSKADFLANMSHEIRTPMNGVLGMTELLLGTEMNRKQRHFARTIHRSGEALLNTINDILDFSKIEAGKLELQSLVFDLRLLIEDVGVMFADRAQRAQLELQCIFPPEAHSIYLGDPDRLRQILTNLVGNALKFTSRGEIVVRAQIEAPTAGTSVIHLDVRDTGIGIKLEHQERIFDSFAQADNSTTREFGGTGLGLAICKKLAALMGGHIGVRSEPGRGSTFWFTCALPQAEPTMINRRRPARLLLLDRRILVADEHPLSRNALLSQLEVWKARVVGVTSGAAALAHMELAAKAGEPVELLIFDRKIAPNALEFAATLRRNTRIPRPSIIVLGTIDNLAETGQWFDAGISSYLSKPVRQSELYDAIADALDLTRPLTETMQEMALQTTRASLPRFSARVLAAEDNPVNQELVRLLLENLGCRVTLVGNGQEAVTAITDLPLDALLDPFDLVLMDCQMPLMDGFAATAAIREYELRENISSRIPIVALTANALEGDRERCLAAQMDDYLAKPFTQRQLAATLERWLPVAPHLDATGNFDSAAFSPASQRTQAKQSPLSPAALDKISALQRPGAPSVLNRVIELYLAAAPPLVAQIQTAVETWNAEQLEAGAHSLRSSSANLGATRLVEICRELETLGRERKVENAGSKLTALKEAFLAVQAALEEQRDTGAISAK